jgi:hypothetical protein
MVCPVAAEVLRVCGRCPHWRASEVGMAASGGEVDWPSGRTVGGGGRDGDVLAVFGGKLHPVGRSTPVPANSSGRDSRRSTASCGSLGEEEQGGTCLPGASCRLGSEGAARAPAGDWAWCGQCCPNPAPPPPPGGRPSPGAMVLPRRRRPSVASPRPSALESCLVRKSGGESQLSSCYHLQSHTATLPATPGGGECLQLRRLRASAGKPDGDSGRGACVDLPRHLPLPWTRPAYREVGAGCGASPTGRRRRSPSLAGPWQ